MVDHRPGVDFEEVEQAELERVGLHLAHVAQVAHTAHLEHVAHVVYVVHVAYVTYIAKAVRPADNPVSAWNASVAGFAGAV